MTKTTMTIGLFDKDTEQQEISTAAANEIIAQTLINEYHIFAFTTWECAGVYKMDSTGNIIREPSIRVEIASDIRPGAMDILIDEITTTLKNKLNQESIMVELTDRITEPDITFR